MRILDRYLLRNFFVPFLYAFLAFVAIWLVIDLSDNGPDFIEGKVKFSRIAQFYISQLPDITLISLPIGLLLALLYCMGRMSRSNEIISMLTAGVSLPRILLPIILFGLLLTGVSTWLNHRLVAHARATKEEQLESFLSGKEIESRLDGHLFRNREGRRTWYAERVLLERNQIHWVQITQQDEENRIVFKYYVRLAEYLPETQEWDFDKGSLVKFDEEGKILSNEYLSGTTRISGWDETPWRIASSDMEAGMLSVPELKEYLKFNADFPDASLAPFRAHLQHRRALPWDCLLVVLMGAPLAIVFSRRGLMGGVASAILGLVLLMLLGDLFLALGAGGRMSPFWAAWLPKLLFLGVGLFLLWFRGHNRDLASLNPFRRLRAV